MEEKKLKTALFWPRRKMREGGKYAALTHTHASEKYFFLAARERDLYLVHIPGIFIGCRRFVKVFKGGGGRNGVISMEFNNSSFFTSCVLLWRSHEFGKSSTSSLPPPKKDPNMSPSALSLMPHPPPPPKDSEEEEEEEGNVLPARLCGEDSILEPKSWGGIA